MDGRGCSLAGRRSSAAAAFWHSATSGVTLYTFQTTTPAAQRSPSPPTPTPTMRQSISANNANNFLQGRHMYEHKLSSSDLYLVIQLPTRQKRRSLGCESSPNNSSSICKSPSWQPASRAPMGASWRLLDWPRGGLSPRSPPSLIQISLAANGRAVQWEGGHLAPTRGSIYECGLADSG